MGKSKRVFALAAVVAVAAAILLAGAAVLSSRSGADDGLTIRANINQDCSSAPWFVGQEKGYFEAFGVTIADKGPLDLDKQPLSLASDKIDVIDASPTALINLLAGGADVKAVAMSCACGECSTSEDVSSDEAAVYWMVLSSSHYHSVADLVSHGTPKIGVAVPGFCMELDEAGWFEENGVSMSQFEFVTIANVQLEDSLRMGIIDAAILPQAFYDIAGDDLRLLTVSGDASSELGEATLLIFRTDFIERNPDAVRAFIQAYKGAQRWCADHPDEAMQITMKRVGMHSAAHEYSYSGEIKDDYLEPWIEATEAAGLVDAGRFGPRDLYTTEFQDVWSDKAGPEPLDPYPAE